MPCYTHKMAIVSWPWILWRHFTLCVVAYLCTAERKDGMESMLSETSTGELLLLFGVIFIVTYLLCRRGNSGRKLPPSVPSLPVVGSLPFLPTKPRDLAEFCISPKNKLGKIFSFNAGSKYDINDNWFASANVPTCNGVANSVTSFSSDHLIMNHTHPTIIATAGKNLGFQGKYFRFLGSQNVSRGF